MAIVVGTVIGSGIFLVPKAMVLRVGSPEMVFAVWVFGGLLTLFGALTYAELAAAMPEAGGEYAYLREAYGPFFGFRLWMDADLGGEKRIDCNARHGAVLLSGELPAHARKNAGDDSPSDRPGRGSAGDPLRVSLFAMAVIHRARGSELFRVKLGGRVQMVITVIKVALIAAIVAIGLFSGQGSTANFSTSVAAAGGFTGFFAAFVAALWAYDGWNNVNMVASEVRNPQRNLPLALIAGLFCVIAIYLLTNLAYFYVLLERRSGRRAIASQPR